MSEKRFVKVTPFAVNDTWDNHRPMECASSLDADVVCHYLNEQQSEMELLHCLISIMKEDKRFIKWIEDKRSELAFEPYSEKGYDGYRCLDKIRGKLYE